MAHPAVGFREYAIDPALAPYVKCIWSAESTAPIFGAGRERMPDARHLS